MPDMPESTFEIGQLAGLLATHLGVDDDAIRIERCPTGKFNTTWFADTPDRPLVLRVAPPDDPALMLFYEYRMMRQEPGLHEIIRERTSAPVPEILLHDASHRVIDRDYLIMERVPGTPLSDHPSLTAESFHDILRRVGQCLSEVHAIHGDHYGYVGPHRPMEPQPCWADAFAIMWNKLIDDIERCGGYQPDEAGHMRRLLDRHRAAFDRSVPASLLHMDVWAQNIMADDGGRLTGLIDWDRGLWGDPEIEFAVLDYCGISEPPLWVGYGSPRDISSQAEIRRVFYLLYEVQKYIFIRRVRSGSPERADAYRRQSLQLARQLG
jgi:aminoglycoside phosphotransferase (APT) family kinase protein